jgi:SAM-dependent methyltransferase
VQDFFEAEFVEALRSALSALWPNSATPIDEVFEPFAGGYRARGLVPMGEQSFTELDVEPSDFIYSNSALEHVREPEHIIEKTRRLLKPGGLCFHSIDLRDHRNFKAPLEFMRMSESEYTSIATENRLRASDWYALLAGSGFEVLAGFEDVILAPSSATRVPLGAVVEVGVTSAHQKEFVEPFRSKSPRDLATIGLQVLCRRA